MSISRLSHRSTAKSGADTGLLNLKFVVVGDDVSYGFRLAVVEWLANATDGFAPASAVCLCCGKRQGPDLGPMPRSFIIAYAGTGRADHLRRQRRLPGMRGEGERGFARLRHRTDQGLRRVIFGHQIHEPGHA
jgi:hypothetical protein